MLESLYQHISIQGVLWLMLLIPLVVFFVSSLCFFLNGFISKRIPLAFTNTALFIGSALSLFISSTVFFTLRGFKEVGSTLITGPLFRWAVSKGFIVEIGLIVDELNLVALLLVSFLFFMAHLYYFSYPKEESLGARIFLPLSQFFLTMTILSDNLVLVFVGWVGLAFTSFLAIMNIGDELGNKRAFCFVSISMLADMILLIFIFLIFATMSAPQMTELKELFVFKSIENMVPYLLPMSLPLGLLMVAAIILKTIPYPFTLWFSSGNKLPSHLWAHMLIGQGIFAAIYFGLRMNFLVALNPFVLGILSSVGLFLAILMAILSLAERDAFVSLWYLLLAEVGVILASLGKGMFVGAATHLVAFGTFALLILFCVSSAVKAAGGRRDLKQLGGLGRRMPISRWGALIGGLSLAGIAPTIGAVTKEGVLWSAYSSQGLWLWILYLVAAALSAFAIFRIVGYIFLGDSTLTEEEWFKVAEVGPASMMSQMILMAGILFCSWLAFPSFFGGSDWIANWFSGILVDRASAVSTGSVRYLLMIIFEVVILHAVVLSSVIYSQRRDWVDGIGDRLSYISKATKQGFYLPKLFMNWLPWFFVTIKNFIGASIIDSFTTELISGFGALCDSTACVVAYVNKRNRYFLLASLFFALSFLCLLMFV
ncbi:MAG: proton-conducting transporter membrane subunit [Pseudomonadota bacterium]